MRRRRTVGLAVLALGQAGAVHVGRVEAPLDLQYLERDVPRDAAVLVTDGAGVGTKENGARLHTLC